MIYNNVIVVLLCTIIFNNVNTAWLILNDNRECSSLLHVVTDAQIMTFKQNQM